MSSPQRTQLHPVFLLHQRPYRDSSAIIDVFSRDHGRFGIVAKGVKGRRGRGAVLQAFAPLLMSWSGRGDLKNLNGLESLGLPIQLRGQLLLSGFYLNELLLHLMQREDPHPDLFDDYQLTLQQLACLDQHQAAGVELQVCLRLFEKRLLQSLGYDLILDYDANTGGAIDPEARYRYVPGQGMVLYSGEPSAAATWISGAALLAFAEERLQGLDVLRQCKHLTRQVLDHYLGGRELHSRRLLLDVQRTIEAGQALKVSESSKEL